MHLHSKERAFGLRCFITLCELAVSILHEAGGRDGGASPRIATSPGEHGEHPGIGTRARQAKGDLTLDAVRFDINQPKSMARYCTWTHRHGLRELPKRLLCRSCHRRLDQQHGLPLAYESNNS